MLLLFESPRSKLRGTGTKWSSAKLIIDPVKEFLFLCSLTPPQAAGNRACELDEVNALAGIHFMRLPVLPET
jgi:hypothetical protein